MIETLMSTCYHCDDLATSVEHIPPRGLFPALKDAPAGTDYRRDLRTVPACSKHNQDSAKDDEYVMYVLSMCLPSNDVGAHLFRTKILRAISKNPSLIKRVLEVQQPVKVHDTKTGAWARSIGFRVDDTRLQRVFEKVARGVYYLEIGSRWKGQVQVIPEFSLSMDDPTLNDAVKKLAANVAQLLDGVTPRGSHLDVFSYQMRALDARCVIRLCFYGDCYVVCVLS